MRVAYPEGEPMITGPKSFKQMLDEYIKEVERLREKKMCLGTGQKGTNIEVQLDNTIALYDKRIKSLSSLQGTKLRQIA
jgi:hypothetical protein